MATDFGLKVISENDRILLDRNGIMQTWVDSVADNMDGSYPMYLRFYLPEETMSVQEISLSFQTERFRSYTLKTFEDTAQSLVAETTHNHSWPDPSTISESHNVGVGSETTGSTEDHTHTYYPRRLASGFSTHWHDLSGSSTEGGEHTHETETHSHGLVFGINISNVMPGEVVVHIQKDGAAWEHVPYSEPDDMDLLPFLDQSDLVGWYTIRFSTDRVTRVTASYMVQALVAVDII